MAVASRANSDYGRFVDEVKDMSLFPLWERVGGLKPGTACVPAHWSYAEVRPQLMRACDLITKKEASRRVLCLENPTLRGTTFICNSLFAGLQIIMPGEVAPSHRHTPSALRFIVEGEGAYTAVAGEKLPMKPGDFVVTPAWAWHDHGNLGTTPVVWLDGLDTPFARFFGAAFYEPYPQDTQPLDRPEGESISVYGMNLIPDEYQSDGHSTPVLIYPYERTRAALDSLAKAGKPHPAHGFRLRYANPATGKHPFPTMAVSMQRLPKGFAGKTYRSTGSAVFAVHRGRRARRRSATRRSRSRRTTCSSRRRGSPTASRPTARSSCSAIPIAPGRRRWATGASRSDDPPRDRWRLAAALSAARRACAAARAAVEEVTMAVPAVGFPFVAGYIADGLKLWEKHGLQGQDHRHRRHRLDQRGDLRQRRVRADFRAVADAGGGERPAPAGHRQHHRQADHRNHDPQGHRRRGAFRSEGAAGKTRAGSQGPHLRDRRRQHRGARLSADRRRGRRARSRKHPRRADGRRQHAGRDADQGDRRHVDGAAVDAQGHGRGHVGAGRERRRGRSAASVAARLQRAGDQARHLREAQIAVREDGPRLRRGDGLHPRRRRRARWRS